MYPIITHSILRLCQKTTKLTILWDIITHNITSILDPHRNQPPNLKIKQMRKTKPGDLIFQTYTKTIIT